MAQSIKAIATVYNGYKFRSRLEARWAVFFETLGVKWEYEKEGFDLSGEWYLPDFWLPKQQCWIEIKGNDPTEAEIRKAGLLHIHSHRQVVICWGDIPLDLDITQHTAYSFYAYLSEPHTYYLDKIAILHCCSHCGKFTVISTGFPRRCSCQSSCDDERLKTAFTAARQARFEHKGKA